MIDGQTSEDARPWGTRMLSPPPVCICETEWRRVVSVFKYVGTVLKLDVQISVIWTCAEFPYQRVCRFS